MKHVKKYFVSLLVIVLVVASIPVSLGAETTNTSLTVPINIKAKAGKNPPSTNTGYVNVAWDQVEGATGYKVWLFNGKEYEVFDVGNVVSWSTQDKGIWPTASEITSGKLTNGEPLHLHTKDKNGTELPLSPTALYTAMGSTSSEQSYFFKVSAYNSNGESTPSSPYATRMPSENTALLGTESFWPTISVPYGTVNALNGNFIISEQDVIISGRGSSLSLTRTRNTQSTTSGVFGSGWTSELDEKIIVTSDGVKHQGADGTIHSYVLIEGTYIAPAGIDDELSVKDNFYVLKSPDQTETFFHLSDGGIAKVVDANGNKINYEYQSGKIKEIQQIKQDNNVESVARKITIAYNSYGHVQTVTDPNNQTINYVYNFYPNNVKRLSTVTNQEKGVTIYENTTTNNNLISVIEPTSAAMKVPTRFEYDASNRLKKVTNQLEKINLLDYSQANQVTVTDPKGIKTATVFNMAGNPAKTIEDVGGKNITTEFIYEGNRLISEKAPEGQTETTVYDSSGNVVSSKEEINGQLIDKEESEYNDNNDVISSKDMENNEEKSVYEGTNETTSEFIANEVDSGTKFATVSTYDQYNNPLTSSGNISAGNNLLNNASFEVGKTGWTDLSSLDSGSANVTAGRSSELGGPNVLKLRAQSTSGEGISGYISTTQSVSLKSNVVYTLSALIKTDLTKANAILKVKLVDSKGAVTWVDNRHNQLNGASDWTKRSLTFKTPNNLASAVVYLEVDHTSATGSGDAWFDAVQLEKNENHSSFNPISNSSFERDFTDWSGTGGAIIDSTSIASFESFDEKKALKLSRSSTSVANQIYTQTITIGQVAGEEPVAYTLTGLSKVDENGKITQSGTPANYSLQGKVTYVDGTTNTYIADFPTGQTTWNRQAVEIPATANKPVNKIEVSVCLKGSYTGTVYFDAIRLMKGKTITKNTYDTNGNYLTNVEDVSGFKSTMRYDVSGNLLEETTKKMTKTFEYDKMNRMVALNLPNGTSVNYVYDIDGTMQYKKIRTANGTEQSYRYFYNKDGKISMIWDPLNRGIHFQYDENGNTIRTQTRGSNVITHTYTALNQVLGTSYNGVLYYTYEYDKNGKETKIIYNKEGGQKTHEYNEKEQLINITERGKSQTWSYSDTGKTTGTKAAGRELSYNYNNLGQNTKVTDQNSNQYHFDFNEGGQTTTITQGNGITSDYTYDDAGLIERIESKTKTGDTVVSEKYTYDENGNRTKVSYSDGTNTSYEYDQFDQLVKETLRDGNVRSYEYDGFGNRVTIKYNGAVSETARYNILNELIGHGYNSDPIEYDSDGNRLEDEEHVYKWNVAGQLESVSTSENVTMDSILIATYKYDERGRRIQKTVNGVETNYFYDGDSINVLYETDAAGTVLRFYNYSATGQLLSMETNGQTYYYHYNAHGDVIALTNQSGSIVEKYSYDSWGVHTGITTSSVGNPIRYAGYRYDEELGMYYLIARYYNPEQGVFLSLDPEPGLAKDVLTQNGFAYCGNNPIARSDSTGLSYPILGSSGKWYDLGAKWRARIDGPHFNGDETHIHLEYNKNEVANQNSDGSTKHNNKNNKKPPNSVKKELKKKLGWDWDKKAKAYKSWLNKQLNDPRSELYQGPRNSYTNPILHFFSTPSSVKWPSLSPRLILRPVF